MYRSRGLVAGGDTHLPPGMTEVSALVLDVGSYNTKVGYAGDSTPKVVLPSHVGHAPILAGVKDETTEEVNEAETASKLAWKTSAAGKPGGDGEDKENMPAIDAKRMMQHYIGLEQLGKQRKDMHISAVMKHGLIDNWEALEQVSEIPLPTIETRGKGFQPRRHLQVLSLCACRFGATPC